MLIRFQGLIKEISESMVEQLKITVISLNKGKE